MLGDKNKNWFHVSLYDIVGWDKMHMRVGDVDEYEGRIRCGWNFTIDCVYSGWMKATSYS